MTRIKIVPTIMAVIIFVMSIISTPMPIHASSDDDNHFSRPTYSLQEMNDGALGDTITFNSIIYDENTDSALYKSDMLTNETNFVGARIDDGDHGVDNVWNGNEIEAVDGQTYIVRLYVHNNSPKGYDAVAEDVKVRFYVPYASSTSVTVNGWLTASNATPNTYLDDVVFKSTDGTPFHLEYITDSARLENGNYASGVGVKLTNSVVNQGNPTGNIEDTWTLIGYDGLDGKIPGCYDYIKYVGIKVKVVYGSDFTIEKKVRIAGDTDRTWKDSVDAKVGDKVEFQIQYINTSDYRQANVGIRDVLPSNLRYVAGSTKIMNQNHPNGDPVNEDYITTDGVLIGNYSPNANAYLMFTAEVVDDDLAEGSNTLVNWAQGGYENSSRVVQDYATVTVYKDTKFETVSTILLVIIVLLIIAIAVLFCMMFRNHPKDRV